MINKTDVVVIGAGPVGLFQVFELGLQGLSVHIIETLPQAGGQCTELYPDKPIYDIPSVVECTGQQLTDNLLKQIEPFNPVFHYNEEVLELEKRGDEDFYLKSSGGTEFECRAVVIAAGGGSFTPVRVRVEGLSEFEDSQLFYRVKDPSIHAGKDLVILGGGDSALDWVLALQPAARSVTVVNRTEKFRGATATVEKVQALADAGAAAIHFGMSTAFRQLDGKLTELCLTLRDEARSEIWVPVDHLLVFFGMSPKLGAVENWGLTFERKHITINTATFETSVGGIYAIGDINTYAGKRKLILSGFHEAALTAYAIKERFEPGKKVSVQYTTTSPTMHTRLGLKDSGDKAGS